METFFNTCDVIRNSLRQICAWYCLLKPTFFAGNQIYNIVTFTVYILPNLIPFSCLTTFEFRIFVQHLVCVYNWASFSASNRFTTPPHFTHLPWYCLPLSSQSSGKTFLDSAINSLKFLWSRSSVRDPEWSSQEKTFTFVVFFQTMLNFTQCFIDIQEHRIPCRDRINFLRTRSPFLKSLNFHLFGH